MSITPVRALLLGALIGPSTEVDAADAAILDATIRCLSRYGLKRMTVTDVATEAGVGRATIFRHFETKEELVRRAFAWELSNIAERFHDALGGLDNSFERAVEWIVESVRVVRTHPVARRLVEDDAALPLLQDNQVVQMLNASVRHELELVTRNAGADFDIDIAAEMIVRFFASVWLTPDIGDTPGSDDGVRRIARTMLTFLAVPRERVDVGRARESSA